jgi:hypothetical protein
VSVLLGNGDGTFQAPLSYSAGLVERSMVVADFNGDGIPDLAVLSADVSTDYQDRVSILLGKRDGTLVEPANKYAAGPYPASVAVGDFNKDGLADLAVLGGDEFGDGTMTILLGNGDGTFQSPQGYSAGNSPNSLAAGDFNGDGFADLAVTGYYDNPYIKNESGTVTILINTTDWRR